MAAKPGSLRVFFKRGLRALLPTVLTVAVFVLAINFLYDNIAKPINDGFKTFLLKTGPGHAPLETFFGIDLEDEAYADPEAENGIDWEKASNDLDEAFYDWIGFVIAIVLIFVFGFFLATFVGSRVFNRVEALLEKFPGVKVVYPYAKQIVEFFTSDSKIEFHSVVAFEWPRPGIWALGFVTGNGFRVIDERAKGSLVNVFLPSCPTPVTGYVLFLPIEDLVLIPISVDEAARFIISGGVIAPESQRVLEEKMGGLLRPPDKTGSGDSEDPIEKGS